MLHYGQAEYNVIYGYSYWDKHNVTLYPGTGIGMNTMLLYEYIYWCEHSQQDEHNVMLWSLVPKSKFKFNYLFLWQVHNCYMVNMVL
jgi:hypothetical protein